MGMLVMGGRHANVLSRGAVSVSTEDSRFPPSMLFDGDPGNLFSFGQAQLNENIVLDADLALGSGDFEDDHIDGAPPGWEDVSDGTADLFKDTAIFDQGAASVKLRSSTSFVARMQRVFQVRAGESIRFDAQMRGNGEVRAQDLDTGQWLSKGLVWQDAETFFIDDTSFSPGSFDQVIVDFTMSTMLVWPKAVRRLGIRFIGDTTSQQTDLWVDAFSLVPGIDTLAIFGHNIRSNIELEWATANNPLFSGSTIRATIAPRAERLYHRLSTAVFDRYHQWSLFGSNVHVAWIGEMLAGTSYLFERVNGDGLPGPTSPIKTQHFDHRIQVEKAVGGSIARGITKFPRRTKSFGFQFPDLPGTAESGVFEEWYGEVFRRSQGGHPFMMVPNTDRQDVLFGHLSSVFGESDGAPGQAGYRTLEGFVLEEMALPVELPEASGWPLS